MGRVKSDKIKKNQKKKGGNESNIRNNAKHMGQQNRK